MTEDVRPMVDSQGVPRCSERCPSFDGKRCEILGHKPENICEPAVVDMAKRLMVVALSLIAMMGMLTGCADDATSTPDAMIDASTDLDACVPSTDAEPANECCSLEGEEQATCAKAQAAPGTCVAIICFHGCDVVKIHGCNL